MNKFFFSDVYFDLENIVYSAWHRMKQRVYEGRMDSDFCFKPEEIAPHVVLSIEERLNNNYGILASEVVVSASNKLLLKYCTDVVRSNDYWKFTIVPDYGKAAKGSQVADLKILDMLSSYNELASEEMGIVIVSGDGCYIDDIVRLSKLGYIVGVVAADWALHKDYVKELGGHSVILLREQWLDEIIRRTIRSLPLAS